MAEATGSTCASPTASAVNALADVPGTRVGWQPSGVYHTRSGGTGTVTATVRTSEDRNSQHSQVDASSD